MFVMNLYNKKLHIWLLVFFAVLALTIYFFIKFFCAEVCTFESKRGLIDPIWSGSLGLSLILAFLLLFPIAVFRVWLKYIASWFIPLAVFVVASISVYSSGVLSIGRGEAALQFSIVLGVITFVFAIGYTIIAQLRNK